MSPKKSTPEARKLLAHNLRLLRLERNWTQEQLADASGLHRTHISQIERSLVNLSIDKLDLLADALGVPLDRLFDTRTLTAARPGPKHPGVEEPSAHYGTTPMPVMRHNVTTP